MPSTFASILRRLNCCGTSVSNQVIPQKPQKPYLSYYDDPRKICSSKAGGVPRLPRDTSQPVHMEELCARIKPNRHIETPRDIVLSDEAQNPAETTSTSPAPLLQRQYTGLIQIDLGEDEENKMTNSYQI